VCKNELRATAYVPSAALIRPASVAPRDKAAQHNSHNGSTPLVARLFSLRKAYEKTDSPGLFGGRQPTARSRIALPGFLHGLCIGVEQDFVAIKPVPLEPAIGRGAFDTVRVVEGRPGFWFFSQK